ncbi:MAG: ATP-binding protein [Acidimicrobiia bacterium]
MRNPFKQLASKAGGYDPERRTAWVTPWAYYDEGGLYMGHTRGEVWLYRSLTLSPLSWEDPGVKLADSSLLANLLAELASTSVDLGSGIKALARSREFHLVSHVWDKEASPPKDTPPGALQDFLEETLDFVAPNKALLLGVKLWSSLTTSNKNVLETMKDQLVGVMGQAVPDRSLYAADRARIENIFKSHGAFNPPTPAERAQLEAWYNYGRTPHAAVFATPDYLYVGESDRIEMAVIDEFSIPEMKAPNADWLLAAQNHYAPASVISIRGELEPSTVSRARIRKQERRIIHEIAEERKAGDLLGRSEQSDDFSFAQRVEQYILGGTDSLVTNTSIVLARRVGPEVPNTYVDVLNEAFGIKVSPLQYRQLSGLAETLPTSPFRSNPFPQDINIATIAYAGLQSFSRLGDNSGIYMGVTLPDMTPLFIDPRAASQQNKPASMLVAGESGSGKTWFCQSLAHQYALAGGQAIFINPKGYSSLQGLAQVTNGRVVKLTDIAKEGGFFDPFRFATPPQAASIAAAHIMTVLGNRGVADGGLSLEEGLALEAGLQAGAEQGAQCVLEALEAIEAPHGPRIRKLVTDATNNPLFRLGIGMRPQPKFNSGGGLLLIEFDRRLDFPSQGADPRSYTLPQKMALGAVRLVTSSCMELLSHTNGGLLILDEAWTFLQTSEGLAALQSLGREGRSQNVMSVFATQRVNDLISEGIDMESHLSRVLVMKLTEEAEAIAALTLCRLEPTKERLEWLRQAGPQQGSQGRPSRGALGIHSDLYGRRSAALLGYQIPQRYAKAYSTTPIVE